MNSRNLKEESQICRGKKVRILRSEWPNFKAELSGKLSQKQASLGTNDGIKERVQTIKRYIDQLDDPYSEMMTMTVDNSKDNFTSSDRTRCHPSF